MKKIWTILFTSLTFANNCPEFYCQNSLAISYLETTEAREYESEGSVSDEIESNNNAIEFKFKKNAGTNSYFQLEVPIYYHGDYVEYYAPSDRSHAEKSFRPDSFREPTFSFEHWFTHRFKKDFFHAIDLSYTPKLYRPSVEQYGSGRHEFKINYHYLRLYKKFFFEGNIYTQLFGRKKLILSDRNIEVTPAFTEVVTNFGGGLFGESWRFGALFSYGQTTNYSNKSKNLTHESDKGFVIRYDVYFSKSITASTDFFISYMSGSRVFNSLEEDLTKDVDFELETSKLLISLIRKF